MRALVTGGAGFIGSHVVDLIVSGGGQAVVLDDLSTGLTANLNSVRGQAELLEGSVTNRDDVGRALSVCEVDAIIHLAAQVSVPRSFENPQADLMVNTLGTLNVASAAGEYGVSTVVLASTSAVYGEGEGYDFLPFRESARLDLWCPYAVTKRTAESYVEMFANSKAGRWGVSLRLANVYGPRQRAGGEGALVAEFGSAARERRAPKFFGDGRQTRDLIHVSRVAEAFLSAAKGGVSGIFNIGTGIETRVSDVWSAFVAESDGELDSLVVEVLPPRPRDTRRSCLDPGLAMKTLDWKCGETFPSGLAEISAS